MSIQINHPGVQATIQDLGRIGAQKYGIVVSGAMDPIALRIGNLLVHNAEGEAGIEVLLYGTTIEWREDQLIAITGGDLQPVMDGKPAPMWRPIYAKKGSTLTFKGPKSGMFAYIAIAGGLDVPKEIGSKSTFSKARIGGYKGRALETGDVLEVGSYNEKSEYVKNACKNIDSHLRWSVSYPQYYASRTHETIRVLKGSEFPLFSPMSQDAFTSSTYRLTSQADRMGYTFEGKPLQVSKPMELLSEGVTNGTIQVPAGGKPIILMAERQTTGGYPKIGQVITADVPKLAQLQAHSRVTFEIVSIAEAEEALFKMEDMIQEIKLGIQLRLTSVTSTSM